MQFQADILEVNVVKADIEELSSMGAVYLAGLAIKMWKSKDEISSLRRMSEVYKPTMENSLREKQYNGWKTAVRRVLSN